MNREMLHCYSLTITLLSVIGLWPYHNEKRRQFQYVINSFVVTSLFVAQLTPFVSGKCSRQNFLRNLSFIIMTLGALAKYFLFLHQIEGIKGIIEGVSRDWKTDDEEELKIIKEHAYMGRRYTTFFAVFIYLSTFGAMALHFSSIFLDIVSPLNETRLYKAPIITEYFVDEQKYYFRIALYQDLAIFIGGTTYVATESLNFMWLQHAGCLYRLVSYRINVAVHDSINDSSVTEKACNRNSRESLRRAIAMHNRTLAFFNDLKSAITLVYSILLVLGVTSLSTNLFCLSQSGLTADNIEESLISLMFVISEMGYMFYGNYVTQQMVDSGDDLFTAMYNTEWYKTPLSTQKSLLFIMLRSIKSNQFNMLLVFNASIEGFSMLVRTSVSYFTVISSTQ